MDHHIYLLLMLGWISKDKRWMLIPYLTIMTFEYFFKNWNLKEKHWYDTLDIKLKYL